MEKRSIDKKFLPGKLDKPLKWRKFENREEIINFMKTAERYWFGEGYGSEKRKTPA